MNRAIAIIWWGMLIATVGAVVPAAVTLLSRALNAARQIERYTAEALEGGVKIAANTASVAALKDTILVAPKLLTAAEHIERDTATIAAALTSAVNPENPDASGNGRAEGEEVPL